MARWQSKNCILINRGIPRYGLTPFYNDTFPEEIMASFQFCQYFFFFFFLKNSTMVEGIREREFLVRNFWWVPKGAYLLLPWLMKFPWFLEILHPIVDLGESLESSGLPVDFWNSRIAMIRRSFMARLAPGGGSQSSLSSGLHTMSPSSETWILMHQTRTDGMIRSVFPNFWTVDFVPCGRAQEIWGCPLFPHVEFRDTACSTPSYLMLSVGCRLPVRIICAFCTLAVCPVRPR